MKKLLFVFNPNSGKGMIKSKLFEVVNLFTKNGYQVITYPTQAANDGYEFIKKTRERYDLIVCAGGDGTLNEVVRGLMDKELNIPVGYIPCGSTNDFASSTGISKSIIKAANQIMNGKAYGIDVANFNDKLFNYVAAFGAFTDVSYATSQELKNLMGHSAYVVEAIKRLTNLKTYRLTLNINGEIITDDFIYGMISNSNYIAGIKGVAGPGVDMNDGLFEVMFIRNPKNPKMVEQLMSGLLMQNIYDRKDVCIVRKAANISIESEASVPWTLDGEFGGDLKEVNIKVINNAFELITTKKIK